MKKVLFSAGVKKAALILIAVLAICFLSIWFVQLNLSSGKIELTFEVFDGEQIEKLVYDIHDFIPNLPKARKDGYYFEGWFLDREFTKPIKKPDDIKKSATLYAKFTLREYTITYHNADAGSNPTSYTILSDDIILAPPPAVAGKTFMAWYANDKFAGKPITEIKKGSVGNLDLYARFRSGIRLPVFISEFNSNAPALTSENTINQYVYMQGDAYLRFENPLPYFQRCTYEIWVKSDTSGDYFIFDHRQENAGLALYVWKDGRLMVVNGYGARTETAAKTFKFDNKWHHLAVTADENSITIYYDSNLIVEDTANAIEKSLEEGPLCLGNNNARTESGFVGCMDEFRLWSVKREGEDIFAYKYAEFRKETQNLVAYSSFNQSEAYPLDWGCEGENADFLLEMPIASANTSLNFDGSKNYATVDSVEITAEMTYEIWVRCNTAKDRVILDHRDGDNRGVTPITITENGAIKFSYNIFEEKTLVSAENIFEFDNEWHHIAVTIKDKEVNIYYDGEFVTKKSEESWRFEAMDLKPQLIIGCGHKEYAPMYFMGNLDEVRIFARAKSAEEIASDREKAFYGMEEDLMLYLDFNNNLLDKTYNYSPCRYNFSKIIIPSIPIPIKI